ncbi:MAG: protein kinase, partial [bacterium]|nr:protein kinase [bacterium]
AAVGFAHRNLVVHRDLKPANILITGDATVKLLDFGVAKLLEPDPRFPALTAAPGATPLSLPYASPEQLSGGPITTAADVYGLGVVLYELLTGRRPHRLDNLNAEQAARVLREQTPSKPSTAVQRRAEILHADGRTDELTPESVSRVRDGDLRRLVRRLRGDLDNVVLRALHPEPEHRFASVEELAEELRRHLDGLPVRSRPQTFFYRSGKFVRRHPPGVAAAALIAILVVGFVLSMAAERRKTALERDRAEVVTDFLVDFIQAPNRAKGESLTVREALGSGVERIDR